MAVRSYQNSTLKYFPNKRDIYPTDRQQLVERAFASQLGDRASILGHDKS